MTTGAPSWPFSFFFFFHSFWISWKHNQASKQTAWIKWRGARPYFFNLPQEATFRHKLTSAFISRNEYAAEAATVACSRAHLIPFHLFFVGALYRRQLSCCGELSAFLSHMQRSSSTHLFRAPCPVHAIVICPVFRVVYFMLRHQFAQRVGLVHLLYFQIFSSGR